MTVKDSKSKTPDETVDTDLIYLAPGIVLSGIDEIKDHGAKELRLFLSRTGLPQLRAEQHIKASQSVISRIVCGKLQGVSAERLLDYLLRLGFDIDVRITRPERDMDANSRAPIPGRVRLHIDRN